MANNRTSMTNGFIIALLTTAVATAQTVPKTTQPGSATSAAASSALTPRTGGPASKSVTQPARSTQAGPIQAGPIQAGPIQAGPIPEQPLRTKLRNANSINPNYNREKNVTGRGTKREYRPRRTASGARKDTMNQRKPGDPVEN